jgi:hypothetical protein
MATVYALLLASFLGAIGQEISHWYELRAKLKSVDFQNMWRFSEYWLITILMCACSVCFPFIWFWDRTAAEPRDYLIYSLSFPIILRKAILTRKAIGAGPKFGTEEVAAPKPLQSYFSV